MGSLRHRLGVCGAVLVAVPALAILAGAGAARAGTLTIDFDFTGSSLTVLGLISIPPNGSFTAATARVSVPAAGSLTASGGTASLQSLMLSLSVDAQITGLLTLTGDVGIVQMGTATGTYNATTGGVVIDGGLLAVAQLALDCVGVLCPGGFPIMSTINDAFQVISFPLGNLSVNGGATIQTTLTVTLNGTTAMLSLIGTEVGRSYVPEPARGLQLAAGGLALVLLAWRVRRRP